MRVLGLEVMVQPGADIQLAVDTNPEGTTFVFESGIYALQRIRPKNNNVFIGQSGAILTGAVQLSSFSRQDSYWIATGQRQQGRVNGQCDSAHPRCMHPEDLFLDDRPLLHVGKLADLESGRWFFDYATDTIYLADDPTGHKVETSVARSAFYGNAANVTVRGLVIEKYATPAQSGAIGERSLGEGWTIESNEIRWNHGIGIRIGNRARILRNHVHHNGQMGIGGIGDDVLIDDNEIAFNNYAGHDPEWEAGGGKFVATSRLVVRNNHSHDNVGSGLWTDIDNVDTLYELNTVRNNTRAGISHEISYAAVIRRNFVGGNGSSRDVWLFDGQIQVQNSQDVEIYDNTVIVPATGGNGITLVQQGRGVGKHGPYSTINNYVHHNVVTHLGNRGANGAVADSDASTMFAGTNRFNFNIYEVPDSSSGHWAWSGSHKSWQGFRAEGQESNGKVHWPSPPAAP